MEPTDDVKVFLSSTGRDLRPYRDNVYHAIQRFDGYQCVRMEDFGARDSSPEEYCRVQVGECEVFVGIVGHTLGACPPGKQRSFTQLEYDAAKLLGKPMLMFVATGDVQIPAGVQESEDQQAAQRQFRQEVLADRVAVTEFHNADMLAIRVLEAIQNQRRTPAVASVLRIHRDDYLRTYARVAVLGDHPAEALDTFPEVAYTARRFEPRARGQVEGPPQRLDSARAADAARSGEPHRKAADERFLLERLAAGGSWILVEGEGGSGKTEFARHACALLADRMPVDLGKSDRIPVFIELRSIRDVAQLYSGARLMAALSECAGALSRSASEATWFHRLAADGRLVIVADGLDELPDPSMFKAFDDALDQARRQFGLDLCSVLVTGRPSVFALTPALRRRAQGARFQPQPLTLQEIEAGIADFFRDDRTASIALARAVAEQRDSVQRLLGIPLFLTLACAFWSRGDAAHILTDPSQLMAQGLEHLLARRLGGEVQQAMDDLPRLAASTCPNFDEIPHAVASRLIDERALESYSRRSGILRGGPTSGLRFGIRPLAEYLAGRHYAAAAEDSIAALYARHVWTIRWREPLFWMAGELWKGGRRATVLALLDRLLLEVEDDRDDLPQTLFERICDLIAAAGATETLPEPILARLSRLLIPMKKSPSAADRIRRFEEEIRSWPLSVRDHLARDALSTSRRTYSHLTVEALGSLRSDVGIDTLVRLSKLRGEERDLRQSTFPALGRIGSASAIGVLVRELESGDVDDVVLETGARALARAGVRSAIPVLVRCLDNPAHADARDAVHEALADLGWGESVPRLLGDIERERQADAGSFPPSFILLAGLASRSQDSRQALERLAEVEADPYLQHIAAKALGRENAITILLPEDIPLPDMPFIAHTINRPSELAGKVLTMSNNDADLSEDREIGTVLCAAARVSAILPNAAQGENAEPDINWYYRVVLDTSDPEQAQETLEWLAQRVDEAAALSSIVEGIGACGSSRSSAVLATFLDETSPRGVLYAAIDALGDPSNRDAAPRIRAWLELDREADDDLGFHAAQTLLKIDPLDAGVVADCLAAQAEDAVIDTFRYYDHTVFVVPTRLVATRFAGRAMLQQPLPGADDHTCVVVAREDLSGGGVEAKPRRRSGKRS